MSVFEFYDGIGWCRLCQRVRGDIGQHHRYAHSLRVARTAELLALRHGLPTKPARVAGLLHDLARLWSTEALLKACEARGLAIDAFEAENPIVLHARIGAALAREAYGIEDQAILQAIERHTVGAEKMAPLDAVVYLADALEPGRDFPERKEYLHLAMQDLDQALTEVYSSTKIYLERRGHRAAPQLEAGLARLTAKGQRPDHTT